MLDELEHELGVVGIVGGEGERQLEHVLAEQRHPGRAVGLLQPATRRQRGAAIEHADVVEPEEAALEDVLPGGVLAVHPPGEVEQQPGERLAQEREVDVAEEAGDGVHEQRGEGVDRRVDVAEVPLVGGDLPARVEIDLRQHQVELRLGEVRIDHRQGDAVERQVPCRVPRVLPLVGHRDHVVVDHVEPRLVARPAALRLPEGMGAALLQPDVDVEVVGLLRPQHPGQRLAHHRGRVGRHGGRREGPVELVGLVQPGSDDRRRVGERLAERFRCLRQAQPRLRRPTRRHDEAYVGCHLGPLAGGVHGGRAVEHVIGDAVLRERR